MKSEFIRAFNQICAERSLPREVVLEAIQSALVSAYRRNADPPAGQNITAEIDLERAEARIYVEREVVAEVADREVEISPEEAQAVDPEAELGDRVMVESTPANFGRIAAQTARQVILQRIREAEREAQFAHYIEQEGELIYGMVQSITPKQVTLRLGRTEAVMPRKEQVRGERYVLHERIRAYVLEVRRTTRGPQIIVSRSHRKMLQRLLELEVPEIAKGTVEIKAIAREAGARSKVAVAARQPGVDPVGACVGRRGVRIQSIVRELSGENVDIIEWNQDAVTFIAKALSPARVLSVHLDRDPDAGNTANVVVPDDQLSLAIGRAGQNARLAAKLTGWRIDIQGVSEAVEWALEKVNEDADLLSSVGKVAEQLPKIAAALRRHTEEGFPYSAEELMSMRELIEQVRGYYISMRDAERARLAAQEAARRAALEEAEAAREAALKEARARIPDAAYKVPVDEIGLSKRVLGHLEGGGVHDVGQVMEHLAEGDEGLLMLDGIGPKSLAEVKEALDRLELPAEEPEIEVEAEEPGVAVPEGAYEISVEEMDLGARVVGYLEEAGVENVGQVLERLDEGDEGLLEIHGIGPKSLGKITERLDQLDLPLAEPEVEAVAEDEARVEAEAAVEEPSAEEEELVEEAPAAEAVVEEELVEEFEAEAELEVEPEEEEEEEEALDELVEREKAERRKPSRKLIYDEELDEVVAVHRHRGDEEEEWEEYLR
ncbi:MAG: transcription termination factor NusA [Anaerolineae bacterium]|jgi:N utilization substance protein A